MPRMFHNLYYPPDSSTGAVAEPTKELGKEDIIEFLNDDKDDLLDLKEDKKVDDKDKKTDDKDKKEDKDDDLEKQIEEELKEEEPDEEQLELMTPVKRREILKEYPDLFKKFPYLERAYYREQQFTELFPTIDDARAAQDKVETLDNIEKELFSGDTSNILKVVKEENPDAFYKLVDNYLLDLGKVDQAAYHHVIGTTIKHTIIAMLREAEASGVKETKEALQSAASTLNQYIFGSSKFEPPVSLAKTDNKVNEEEKKVSDREQAFLQRQFDTAVEDLNTRVNNSIRSTIDNYIDPKGSMTDYVKRNASREALETLSELIENDTRFKSLADKLWERVKEADFSRESVEKIRSAYLNKAKTLLPSVIKKARNEALKGLGKRVSDDDNKDRKGPLPTGRESGHSNSPKNDREKAKQIPGNVRTIDYLMQDD